MTKHRLDDTTTHAPSDEALGLNTPITRRDFLGDALIGAGAALVTPSVFGAAKESDPPFAVDPAAELNFNGPPGAGDYARSNGNTWKVLSSAHQVRDGRYSEKDIERATDTGERFDMLVVGGGAAGLGSAYNFRTATGDSGRCLILDNHPVFGGEAKQNEFDVDGVRLIAPQGSNMFATPTDASQGQMYDVITDIGVPTSFEYADLQGTSQQLEFDTTNYMYLWLSDQSDSVGLFADGDAFGNGRRWLRNPWVNELKGLGIPEPLRAELVRYRQGLTSPHPEAPEMARFRSEANPSQPRDSQFDRWLDTITYRDFLMNVHHLPAEVVDYTEPYVASAIGLGSSVVSAYAALKTIALPGLGKVNMVDAQSLKKGDSGNWDERRLSEVLNHRPVPNSFPGGNSGLARALLKYMIPDGITGGRDFADVVAGRIRFDALDRRGSATRVRLQATVIDVRALGSGVRVTYEKGGRLYSVRGKKTVMALGGWIAKHIVRDLPKSHADAYGEFKHSSVLVANVALRNWRFMEKLGVTSCLYTGGEFGFSCNIRRPMVFPTYRPPFDPGKPAVLTFYAPVVHPNVPAREQAAGIRAEIFATPFKDYERRIRSQMMKMFGNSGLDPTHDIAGLTLNRWGHAYVVPDPGFFYGKDGKSSNSDVIRQNVGPIAFAAAELNGIQTFVGAVKESHRAIEQLLKA
jgi:spermidine dehydrogenase